MRLTNVKVFISYAKEDKVHAYRLQKDLRKNRIGTWLDRDDLIHGSKWQLAISEAIQKCTHFITLLSLKSVNKRGYFQAELKEALDEFKKLPEDKIFIIPVRLEPCEPPSSHLMKLHWLDMFPDWSSGIDKLVKTLIPFPPLDQISRFILQKIPNDIKPIGLIRIDVDTVEFEYEGHMSPSKKQNLIEDVFCKYGLVLVYNPQA